MARSVETGVTGGAPNLLGSFTAAARPLPENTDWQAFGTSHVPENCGFAWLSQECAAGDDKPFNAGQEAVEFRPFLIEYNAQSCGGIPGDWESLEGRARRGLAVRVSNALDLSLSSSIIEGGANINPNLPDLATDITPVGGAGLGTCTLAGLIQDAYACGATGELYIHAPAWVLPSLLDMQLVTQVGNVWKMGPHTVILDQGFSNEQPSGSAEAEAGEAWFYVTGPFEYATGSVTVLEDTTKGVSPRLNRANVIVAQLAIYRFDPCCVFAALVTVC